MLWRYILRRILLMIPTLIITSALIFAVIGYLLTAWFLMKIFEKAGVQGKWRAWVPFYNTLIFAKLGDLNPWWLLAMPLVGYGFAWVGHFFFEKNRPATFQYPLWSLMGDWRMFWETVSGKRRF